MYIQLEKLWNNPNNYNLYKSPKLSIKVFLACLLFSFHLDHPKIMFTFQFPFTMFCLSTLIIVELTFLGTFFKSFGCCLLAPLFQFTKHLFHCSQLPHLSRHNLENRCVKNWGTLNNMGFLGVFFSMCSSKVHCSQHVPRIWNGHFYFVNTFVLLHREREEATMLFNNYANQI